MIEKHPFFNNPFMGQEWGEISPIKRMFNNIDDEYMDSVIIKQPLESNLKSKKKCIESKKYEFCI
ncbi:hypothetical protein DERP_002039 [Dermatophagoides pteronyssinus]|uniref:Uncharacterized protein n=1 Tax=Dermatophagoides pteronyssinus TaxID=6956 RepID=A0ABQ8JHE7_DERPT|nr:hypothetical protein DERP_002039 [Dermatophagoides pteronyssinus]